MYDEIRKYLKNGIDLIVDNNFKDFINIRKIICEIANITIYCVYCVADSTVLAERYNDRIIKKIHNTVLYTLTQYPIIEGVSEFHNKIDCNDVERMRKLVREKTFGDYILEINTNNIISNIISLKSLVFCVIVLWRFVA